MNAPMIIPVIHVHDLHQAMANAQIAHQAGCEGVMLIQMEGQNELLADPLNLIKQEWPEMKVGINLLGVEPSLALEITRRADMTWTDAQPTHTLHRSQEQLFAMREAMEEIGERHLLFCGVAFKHQAHEPNPGKAALDAVKNGWIPTTSGAATGVAADPEKIKEIRQAIGPDASLAIASGVTPDNVGIYAPFVTHILVSTGINSSFYYLDDRLLAKLMVEAKATTVQ